MPIRVLLPEIAMKIAAGEIIERPSSVVKELIENSLDAGATVVTVEVRGGGTQLLRITDDGSGIPAGEVDLAFRRHATSKISGLADLQSVKTLGFRGEALPSIISVADVTLLTRVRSALAGTYVGFKRGILTEQGSRGCPEGTTVTVRNLFATVPARLKFLKSTSTEVGQISQLVSQCALAYPGVKFTLIVEGKDVFHSPGSGKLLDVVAQLYGLETARQMIEIDRTSREGEDGVRVWGCVSPPSVTRNNRTYMSIFVNKRWVQNRRIAVATEEAYRGMLQVGRHPIVVLNVDLAPTAVDVNVHPAKGEVKFVREDEVFDAVYRPIRAALVGSSAVPAMHLPTDGGYKETSTSVPMAALDAGGWSAGLAISQTEDRLEPRTSPIQGGASTLPFLRVVGQMGETYVIAEGPDGMYLIDQHTAHERVLFEKIRGQLDENRAESQGILDPLLVELTPSQNERLQANLPALVAGGFAVETFGSNCCLLRAVPSFLREANPKEAFLAVLDDLSYGAATMEWKEKLAMSMACHGAVRAGQALSIEEMRDLIRQLEKTNLPRTCPHGRPTMVHLSSSLLEKEFGRR
ncbi:MAG: DNA mismatch repair endonuclease MutL [Dehalococcoidia bacterium]|nr:DNA mismatch repair endonuclease MutL [Dehalococcoidia bacterium]